MTEEDQLAVAVVVIDIGSAKVLKDNFGKDDNMKIAIPVGDKTGGEDVAESFGRAAYFLIYDTKTKKELILKNDALTQQGGAGVKAAQIIVDSQVQALLTVRCGQNAADVLEGAGIKVYKTLIGSVKDNIAAFSEGKLSLLDDIHPSLHNHGNR